jgi:hypothetical protein
MKQIEMFPGMRWEDLLEYLNNQDVVLTHQGHAVALLSDFDDDDLEWYAQERNPTFLASLVRAREQAGQGKTIRHEDLKPQLGLESQP